MNINRRNFLGTLFGGAVSAMIPRIELPQKKGGGSCDYASHFHPVKISATFAREKLWELGSRTPYFRYFRVAE